MGQAFSLIGCMSLSVATTSTSWAASPGARASSHHSSRVPLMGEASGTEQFAVSSTRFIITILWLKSLTDLALKEPPHLETLTHQAWLEGPGEPAQGHMGCVDNVVEDTGVHVENSDGGARNLSGSPPPDA